MFKMNIAHVQLSCLGTFTVERLPKSYHYVNRFKYHLSVLFLTIP